LHFELVIVTLLMVSLACDDAKIRIWIIPEDGIDGTLTEPFLYLKGSYYFFTVITGPLNGPVLF